jgi:hypothetical protein
MEPRQARGELSLEMESTLSENGSGATLYFKKAFRGHPGFPLVRGEDVHAVTIPETAVVLFPADDDPDLPRELTVTDPESYRLRTEPVPDPTD